MTGTEAALDPYADAVLRLPAVPERMAALAYSVAVQLYAHHLTMAKFAAAESPAP